MTNPREASPGERWLPEVFFVLLVVLIFADPLFTRRAFTGRDLLPYNLPIEREMHAAYARGVLPLWTQHISGGRPLLPNPNLGALYPIRPLLSGLSFPAAFRLFPVIHWILAGVGMMRLLRAVGARGSGAFLAAVTYVFSGVGVSEVFYTNQFPGMALLPWVVWAAARPVRTLSARIVPLAIVIGVDCLAGDVFTIAMGLAAAAAWIVLEVPPPDRTREALRLAGATVLGALLAAPQIVASALWAPLTHRAVGGLPLEVATAFSVRPWRLLELLVPYPFGPTWNPAPAELWGHGAFRNYFATLFCGGIVLFALARLGRERGRGARFVLWVAAVAAAACVLPSFVPKSWGSWRSPIPLRYPEKLSAALVLALAVGVGLSVESFRRRAPRLRPGIAAACLLAAAAVGTRLFPASVASAAAAAVGLPLPPPVQTAPQISSAFADAGILFAATLIGLDLFARRGARAEIAGLLLLAAVPIAANRRVARTAREDEIFSPPPFARMVARDDPAGNFRTLDESPFRPATHAGEAPGTDPEGNAFYRGAWFLYTPCLWDRGTVLNSDPDVGDFSRMESVRRLSAFFPSVPNGGDLFASLSLRHGIRYRDQEPLPGFRRRASAARQDWDISDSALPSIRVPARARESEGPVEALHAVPLLTGDEVVVESGRRGDPAGQEGRVEAIDDRPERLRFLVTVGRPSWVFVLRGFWPYRTVLVDGRPAEPVPAQLAFSALRVEPGRHRVEWRENLPGAPVSWLGPVLFAAAIAGLRRRDRSAAAVAASPEAP